jgi:7,8-dihydroneopterin aldolase/epimerase/oxygenase
MRRSLAVVEAGTAGGTGDRMTIFIAGLEMQARIGVHDHEHGRTQTLLFDIEFGLDPAIRDDLADTLDYETVVQLVNRVLGDGHIQLVETVARRVADALRYDLRVKDVVVRVTKPTALPGAGAAGVVWSGPYINRR